MVWSNATGNGNGNCALAAVGACPDIVDDTSPKLGGDLDPNAQEYCW